jgi:hypothetical protein
MSTVTGLLLSLAIGLLASLLWVLVLFCIRPRLKVEVQTRTSQGQSGGDGWAFSVTNRSFVRSVQVQARLWHIAPVKDGYPTRTAVELKIDTLFQLNGRWADSRRTPQQVTDHVGSNSYRFLTEQPDRALDELLVGNGTCSSRSGRCMASPISGAQSTRTIAKEQLPRKPSPVTRPQSSDSGEPGENEESAAEAGAFGCRLLMNNHAVGHTCRNAAAAEYASLCPNVQVLQDHPAGRSVGGSAAARLRWLAALRADTTGRAGPA